MTERQTQSAAYWGAAFTIEEDDLEALSNLLLEEETPLTTAEMAREIIQRRCAREAEALRRRHEGAVVYLPREAYSVGQMLTFPAFSFSTGTVVGLRPGHNPDQGEFDVIAVDFGGGRPPREFASRLAHHQLNEIAVMEEASEAAEPGAVFEAYGASIAAKLEARLSTTDDIVRIAGRWFPRALLVNINAGHLNLAEAVLDMAGGGPLPPEALLKDLGLPDNANLRLQAFSLNYALQEDERFDEVGPAGQVEWYLRRLEPAEVLQPPRRLEPPAGAPGHDHARLTPTLLSVKREVDDEWSPAEAADETPAETTVTLTFPHRRSGTLPLNPRLARLFPTAYESPRVRCTLVDGETGAAMPAWVVRAGRYVYGLAEWYARLQFPAGGLLKVLPGDRPGEVVLHALRRRPTREWVRTAGVGPDGLLRFAMQKQLIGVDYDDLALMVVENPAAVDDAWLNSQKQSFERLVAHAFRELAKLDTQGKVHAKTLYAAVNIVRRSPPGPIFDELVSRPYYAHVGDAYWRFDQSFWTD